jgi:hypothetical protein
MMRFGSADCHCLACGVGTMATAIMLYCFKIASVFVPTLHPFPRHSNGSCTLGFVSLGFYFLNPGLELLRRPAQGGNLAPAFRRRPGRYAQLNIQNWRGRLRSLRGSRKRNKSERDERTSQPHDQEPQLMPA